MNGYSRIVLVSNRLPVTLHMQGHSMKLEQSGGGLATGLRSGRWREGSLWIGWPGESPPESMRPELERQLAELGTQPIYLTRAEQKGFYEDFSNAVIWPVFHDLIDQLPLLLEGWSAYQHVNEKFARAIADAYQPGDLIWIHDYQLMLVPAMVKALVPRARIGFFLHIPFPPHEVFRVIPERRELIEGLAGADLIGFHTQTFADNFLASAATVLGLRTGPSSLKLGRRNVQVGVFPMGVDAAAWEARSRTTRVAKQVLSLIQDAGRRKILVGIDRLDYTKGLLRRISAIERLLQEDRDLAEQVRFIQVVYPSRERIESYAGLRRQLNEIVGRLNANYGSARSLPVHLINRSFSEDEVSALYSAADIMLVTPIRDGMNLVAKEFIASRQHDDGVLVLSEFAGAADELTEALLVNPYDTEGMALTIRRAIEMPPEEQRERMTGLRAKVMANDVHRWSQNFLDALSAG
ncbi:MAG TPA: trehalose-6-phosphate synthase [Dehalococcoidia bacterium]|nr:trehalose-6-phosphate synthase [Dehalococcoidia bacterium]